MIIQDQEKIALFDNYILTHSGRQTQSLGPWVNMIYIHISWEIVEKAILKHGIF